MATGHSSFDRIATTTLQNHGKEIFDAVSTNNALLADLKKRGNIKVVSGGRQFTHPLVYQLNSSFTSYGKLDTIATPLSDRITRAVYDIKVVAGSIVLSTLEEAMNAGDREKLISLAGETRKEAEISMSEVMGDQVFKDGSTSNDFDGLQNIINEDRNTECGGITASTTNAYWRPYSYDTAVTAFNTSSNGLTAMDTVLNNTTFGRQGPRLVITTSTVFQLYHIGLTANVRYTKLDVGDTGFRSLAYATMPVVIDDNCPAGNMYFVDTENLWLQLLAKGNFKITPFEYSHNQLTKVALYYVFGNLTCGSRRTQGVIDSITG